MNYTEQQIDALTEVVNIGVGRAAAALSELVGESIDLNVPKVEIYNLEEFCRSEKAGETDSCTTIVQEFQGAVSGKAVLAFPKQSGLKLAQVLGQLEATPEELDLDLSGILSEVGNVVLNGVLGSLGNILQSMLIYSVPELISVDHIKCALSDRLSKEEASSRSVIIADTNFRIASRDINGQVVILFQMGSVETIIGYLLNDYAL